MTWPWMTIKSWSTKLWYKYWILTFLNTVKWSKLLVKKILMGWHSAQFYRNQKKLDKISWPCLTVKHGQGKTCWPCMTMKHGQIRLSLLLWVLLQLQTRSVDCWYQELFFTIKFSHSTPNKTLFVTSWLDHEWPSNMVYEAMVQILDFDLFKYS